jgi:hypothetical protein
MWYVITIVIAHAPLQPFAMNCIFGMLIDKIAGPDDTVLLLAPPSSSNDGATLNN